ncbi:hypothetical protein ABZ951_19070, partial [Streptomyces sp. NPDC046215]
MTETASETGPGTPGSARGAVPAPRGAREGVRPPRHAAASVHRAAPGAARGSRSCRPAVARRAPGHGGEVPGGPGR